MKKQETELLSNVAEVLTAIHVVQAFAREEYQARQFDWESRQAVGAGLEARAMKAKLPPLVDVIVAAGTCLVLGYGAHLVLSNRLTTGDLIVLLFYLGKTYKPIRDLSKITNSFTKAGVSYDRIQEVLHSESAVRDLPEPAALRLRGLVEFDHVARAYTTSARPCATSTFGSSRARSSRCRIVRRRQEHDREPHSAFLILSPGA